jgi:transglutaminase superfamily protein
LTKSSPRPRSRLLANWRAYVVTGAFLVTLAFGISEAVLQHRESRYVAGVAEHIVRQANARDTTATIIALRDYLRRNVTANNYSVAGRPFFRDTAAYALQTGKGRCGESTRAFINMAESLGIHAQRLYLEGELEHVVAVVTFNLHRWLKKPSLPANTYDPPGLSYFMENPHALKALFCFTLSAACMALWTFNRVRRYVRGRRTVRISAANVPSHSPALATLDR